MWIEIIIITITIIAISIPIIKRGRMPEWTDLYGEEYLKWKRGEKPKKDVSD